MSDIGFPLGLRFAYALILFSALTGCFVPPMSRVGPPIVPPMMLASGQVRGCGQDQLAHLAGKPFTELANYRLPGHLRVLRPGQGVTRDLMPDRLNAQVDGSGVILRLFCG